MEKFEVFDIGRERMGKTGANGVDALAEKLDDPIPCGVDGENMDPLPPYMMSASLVPVMVKRASWVVDAPLVSLTVTEKHPSRKPCRQVRSLRLSCCPACTL